MESRAHKFYVPLGNCIAWVLGGLLSYWISTSYLQKDPFLGCVVTIYLSLLLECIFTFIDLGAVNATERFTGRVFYVMAFIFFHCFTSFLLILYLIKEKDTVVIISLCLFIAFLRFSVSWLAANCKIFMANVVIESLKSNQIN